MSAALGAEVRAAPEMLEVAVGVVADEHDVAAASTVAAVGATLRDVSFAPEAHATVAAATGLNVDSCSIFHCVEKLGLPRCSRICCRRFQRPEVTPVKSNLDDFK